MTCFFPQLGHVSVTNETEMNVIEVRIHSGQSKLHSGHLNQTRCTKRFFRCSSIWPSF